MMVVEVVVVAAMVRDRTVVVTGMKVMVTVMGRTAKVERVGVVTHI